MHVTRNVRRNSLASILVFALVAGCSSSSSGGAVPASDAAAPPSASSGDAAAKGDAAAPSDATATSDAQVATLGVIDVAGLQEALKNKDFLLLNVHTPYEGDIPGTDKDIAYTDIDGLAAYIGADLDKKVIVYCKTNYMSGIAGAELVKRGYRAVRYLDGGMNAWTAAGGTLNQ